MAEQFPSIEVQKNKKLNALLDEVETAIENDNLGVLKSLGFKKMIKITETEIRKADQNSKEMRYKPGNKLITYTGIDDKGKPSRETWNNGIANIEEDSVILSNGPIKYPKGHKYEGQVVKGFYNENGEFTIDQKKGTKILKNEYVSDVNYVKKAYGIDATTKLQKAVKLISSYVKKVGGDILEDGEDYIMIGKANIKVDRGGYIIVNVDETGEKPKFMGVAGITKEYLRSTYRDYDEYIKNKNN